MNIVDYIPIGSKNAITRSRLCEITGLKDRELRQAISMAESDEIIINLQDGRGYFIPNESEKVLIERYYQQEFSRLKMIAKKLKKVRSVLNG